MHIYSFLNMTDAVIFLNLRGAGLNYVYEVLHCKTCRTFDTGSLLASIKLRTDP